MILPGSPIAGRLSGRLAWSHGSGVAATLAAGAFGAAGLAILKFSRQS